MGYLDSAGLARLWTKIKARLPMVISNKTVPVSAFVADSSYTGFPYRADISCTGVTSSMAALVTFSPADAVGGNFAPFCATGSGKVSIYAAAVPNASTVIPCITVTVGG